MTQFRHYDLEDNSNSLIGSIALKRGQLKEALKYFSIGGRNPLGVSLSYQAMHQTDSAIHYGLIALDFAHYYKDQRTAIAAAEALANSFSEKDPRMSNQYLRLSIATKDSLYNINKVKMLESIRLKKQEETFDAMNRETYFRNKIIQISLIALAAAFLIPAILLYRNNKVRKAANEKLEKAYRELTSAQAQLIQSEKMASLGELTAGIAHEIQNPLNFVNNFSELNKDLIDELREEIKVGNNSGADEIALVIQENEDKINHHGRRADSIVKSMLQHSHSSKGSKELVDLNALADEYLRLSYHGLRAKDKSFQSAFTTSLDPTLD